MRRSAGSTWTSFAIALVFASMLLAAGVAGAQDAPPKAAAAEEFDPLFDDFDDAYDDELEGRAGFPDPLENSNRAIFTFNGHFDRFILDPLTTAYGFVFPGPVKASIRSFFANLSEPATIFNDMTQLEWSDAGVACSRLVVNSTLGIAGLFDPAASWMGLEAHSSNFGQTLALAGTPSGAYLVIPIMGPTNVRDGLGVVADLGMHPITWFVGPLNFAFYGLYTGSQGISIREHHVEQMRGLRDSSVDYYSALGNAYYQNRTADIWARREHRRQDWSHEPDSAPGD